MDPETLAMLLFQGSGALPPMPPQTPQVAVPPVPTPTTVQAAVPQMPPAPLPPVQSFEPTNTGNPMVMGPNEAYRSEPYQGGGVPSTLGRALNGPVPVPQARPAEAPGAAPAGGGNALLNTLKGVKMPDAPVAQKVSTPHAPQVAKIQAGNLADLLASLGIGPQQALPGLKLPSTLGQALGGR